MKIPKFRDNIINKHIMEQKEQKINIIHICFAPPIVPPPCGGIYREVKLGMNLGMNRTKRDDRI